MIDIDGIGQRFEALSPCFDERRRWLFAASEAQAAGHGGITAVSRIIGPARSTIGRGLRELRASKELSPSRVRRPGGKPLTSKYATLLEDLRRLVEPTTCGDPENPPLWTAKSLRKLADELRALGHRISHVTVGVLLRQLGYSLQGNAKTKEGKGRSTDMKVMLRFLRQLSRDTSGAAIIVYALLLALIAGIAGFGMVIFSDTLTAFYINTGEATLAKIEFGKPPPRCVEVDSNCKAGR